MKLSKDKILRRMAQLHWEFKDLAKELRITKQALSLHLVKGRPEHPQMMTLYKFAYALKCEVVDIVEDLKEKEEEI